MPDLEKYKNDGWGLTRLALQNLDEILHQCISEKGSASILEFGSGSSTRFFVDSVLENNWQDKVRITSFDDNREFMPKFDDAVVSSFLSLHERELIECDDSSFERMFSDGQYQADAIQPKTSALHTRQRNNFYNIQAGDLQGQYDIVVLDGPHGNGRSMAFLHLVKHLASPCYVLIDDHTHHDFEKRMLSLMSGTAIKENQSGKPSRQEKLLATFSNKRQQQLSQWHRGGDFVIYQISESETEEA